MTADFGPATLDIVQKRTGVHDHLKGRFLGNELEIDLSFSGTRPFFIAKKVTYEQTTNNT